jgi:hypothetical protein
MRRSKAYGDWQAQRVALELHRTCQNSSSQHACLFQSETRLPDSTPEPAQQVVIDVFVQFLCQDTSRLATTQAARHPQGYKP